MATLAGLHRQVDDIMRADSPRYVIDPVTSVPIPKNPAVTPPIVTDTLNRALLAPDESLPGRTRLEAIIESLVKGAASGDFKRTQEILNRVLGTPIQTVRSTSVSTTLSEFLESVPRTQPPTADRGGVIDVPTQPTGAADTASLFD